MKSLFYTILLFSIFVVSCGKTTEVLGLDTEAVYIRFKNTTEHKMTGLTIDGVEFEKIRPNKKSKYGIFESFNLMSGQPIVPYEVTVNGNLIQQKTHFMGCGMGLVTLEPGFYTLEVSAHEGQQGNAWLTFEETQEDDDE